MLRRSFQVAFGHFLSFFKRIQVIFKIVSKCDPRQSPFVFCHIGGLSIGDLTCFAFRSILIGVFSANGPKYLG